MKPLLLLSFIAAVILFSCKKSANTTSNSAGGTVLYKTVRTDAYFDTLTTAYYLNSQGLDSAHIISLSTVGGYHQTSKLLFDYNDQGKMTKMTEISTEGLVAATFTFSRDDKGRIVRTHVSPANARYTYGFAYNDAGQVIADTMYNSGDGRLISYQTYSYDNNGNQAGEEMFSAKDHPLASIGKFTWSFDDKPNPYHNPGFSEMLLATDATRLLGPNNAVGQFTLTGEPANIPLNYGYYSEGLLKYSTDKSSYNVVYYYH